MRTTKTSVIDIIAEMDLWVEELMLLREIIMSTGLKEEIKWGGPLYTLDGKNVLGLGGFKNHFAIWFHQGVFLSDPANVLVNANEGVTRGLRQWRFMSKKDIKPALVKKYVKEAVQNAKVGKEIKPERKKPLPVPSFMASEMKKNKLLSAGFQLLTPGKKREYIEYIIEAKGADTRMRRWEKCKAIILKGQGLNDRYR